MLYCASLLEILLFQRWVGVTGAFLSKKGSWPRAFPCKFCCCYCTKCRQGMYLQKCQVGLAPSTYGGFGHVFGRVKTEIQNRRSTTGRPRYAYYSRTTLPFFRCVFVVRTLSAVTLGSLISSYPRGLTTRSPRPSVFLVKYKGTSKGVYRV